MKNQQIKCSVVMLTTNQQAIDCIILQSNKTLFYHKGHLTKDYLKNSLNATTQHLYIVSDREIKEGDWCEADGVIWKYNKQSALSHQLCQKIEATTDPKLWWKQSEEPIIQIPKISIDFIKKYVEMYNSGKPIVDVMLGVVYAKWMQGHKGCGCKEGFQDLCDNHMVIKGHEYCKEAIEIKVNESNEVSIHPIQDTFTRAEVLFILKNYNGYLHNNRYIEDGAVQMIEWFQKNY